LTFSASVLIIAGIMRILDAIWAFRYNGAVPDNLNGAILGHSLTAYGWYWLVVGAILLVAGCLILSPSARLSSEIARWVGILAAAIGGISAIAWMPYYPVWSLVYVAIAIIVIYGLTAHVEQEAETS
jgi:hypothetical protein